MTTESDTTTPLLTVEITSFSFKATLPPHLFSLEQGRHGGGFIFDCRSLPNPGREARFKLMTGLQDEVINHLEAAPEVGIFREHTFALIHSAVTNFLERGFSFMSVGFGCTGGQHRSVFFAQQLGEFLNNSFAGRVSPQVIHYNLTRIGLLP
jgi:RNase adaptor protein for sRNA GlmZ degradation